MADLNSLTALVRTLRSPEGCPWDRRQKLGDLRAYVVEEAHELAAAIDAESWDEVAEEMGDLLFQLVFVAELATEEGLFGFEAVVEGIRQKMVDRHPHVFGSEALKDADEVHRAWEKRKAAQSSPSRSVLDGVQPTLPALVAAYRLGQKAAGVGFDWHDAQAITEKLEEELSELRQELSQDSADADPSEGVREELGDLLFTAANLSRKLGVDPEAALSKANRKFQNRFREMEGDLSERGTPVERASTQEMERAWDRVKERLATRECHEKQPASGPEDRPPERT